MDFRIQNKSTGTPTPLSYHSNNHHRHNEESPAKHNPTTTTTTSPPSQIEKQQQLQLQLDPPKTHPEVSSFTPSPTIDDAPNHHHHHHHQRPRKDLPRSDPTTHIHQVGDPIPPPTTALTTTTTSSRYRECQKNHAAHLGSHVVDGCGEFMPSGEEYGNNDSSSSASSLRCAACGCHRNFHRKETEGESSIVIGNYKSVKSSSSGAQFHHHNHPSPLQQTPISIGGIVPHQQHFRPAPHHHHDHANAMMMTFGEHRHPHHQHHHHHHGSSGGAAAESSSEDLNLSAGFSSKKRFRTKFTQEQKDKMQEFAQRIGFKIQKPDEAEVQQFCADVGVKRKVFKVWMHNNKQQQQQQAAMKQQPRQED